jgi:tRNA-specific 2-thiouridylase
MTTLRVLAAMSGGVDSAVAAARAAEAGHDMTGVHLALSRNPSSYRTGARGCCTLEDARDTRRAADVIGIPFYVWDLAERFHADVVQDFVDEYARGSYPQPRLRCNEKIKFAAVLTGRLRSASTPSAPDITPAWNRVSTARAWSAAWMRPRTSPTCWPC